MNDYSKNIRGILTQEGLVNSCFPSMAKIIEQIKKVKTINLVYGETYDSYGLTVDSLKYYFFLSLFHKELEKLQIPVKSYVIIGDSHAVKNKLVQNKEMLLSFAQKRLVSYQKLKEIYGLKSEAVLLSSLCEKDVYKKNLEYVRSIVTSSTKLMKIVEKTVLTNRLTQEKEAGFQYAIEEIALIAEYDLKVGPPREIYYDKIANYFKEQKGQTGLCSIYLKPTYPLGFNFDYFVSHGEIEKYGLTPYKAGSNKLQDQRIIIGSTDLSEIKRLIDDSYVPKNPVLPNPVFDLYTIADMARILLDKNKERQITADNLKEETYENLEKYILSQLANLKLEGGQNEI